VNSYRRFMWRENPVLIARKRMATKVGLPNIQLVSEMPASMRRPIQKQKE
jgi:hypothetical protein